MRNYITFICTVMLVVTLIPARATAYCLPGKTASGKPVAEGVCAGGNKYYGKTLRVYQRKPDGSIGSLIGTYECCDKGGTDAIKKGYVIDIWQPDLDSCQDFMDLVYMDGCQGKIYIEVIDE